MRSFNRAISCAIPRVALWRASSRLVSSRLVSSRLVSSRLVSSRLVWDPNRRIADWTIGATRRRRAPVSLPIHRNRARPRRRVATRSTLVWVSLLLRLFLPSRDTNRHPALAATATPRRDAATRRDARARCGTRRREFFSNESPPGRPRARRKRGSGRDATRGDSATARIRAARARRKVKDGKIVALQRSRGSRARSRRCRIFFVLSHCFVSSCHRIMVSYRAL